MSICTSDSKMLRSPFCIKIQTGQQRHRITSPLAHPNMENRIRQSVKPAGRLFQQQIFS